MAETAMASCAAGNSQGIGGVACSINDNFSGLGDMLLGGSFLGGVGFVGAGLLKLKEASQQGQAKYSDGVWRLGVGSALIALPTMATVGKSSLFQNSASGNLNNNQSVSW